MFAWIQRLLPRRSDFFRMFEAHAATLVAGAGILQDFAAHRAPPHEALEKIQEQEHRADDIIREVLTEVRLTFLTPFDRSSITSLMSSMDDTIDEMLAAARAIDLYRLRDLRPEMKEIVQLISEASAVTAEAVPLLRNVTGNGPKLHQLTGRLAAIEGEADDLLAEGLKHAFETVSSDPLQFAIAREVFRNLERVTDAFEDVANEIDGIVIDHA